MWQHPAHAAMVLQAMHVRNQRLIIIEAGCAFLPLRPILTPRLCLHSDDSDVWVRHLYGCMSRV